jgi:hypothetical protein
MGTGRGGGGGGGSSAGTAARRRVLELGAGTRLCGLMIALMFPDCTIEFTNLPKLQDLMCLNVKHNFRMSSPLGDAIVLCRVLWWGVESNYAGVP